jgi:anti-anti-sigma regulatory factor
LKRARTRDGDLVLVTTGVSVRKVLEITGLTRVFDLHTTREAALAGGPAPAA